MRGRRASGRARSARRLGVASLALALAACAWLRAAPAPAPPEPPPPPPAPAPTPPPPCTRVERIEVRKSERRLVAECAGGGRLELEVGLSREPGAKQRRGDERTPEGEYRIAGRARPSGRFHRFLAIDYPSDADAERALAEGRIGSGERDAIAAAHRRGRLPPQNTVLGGWLGFHGEGRRWQGDLDLDWTEGCFALSDEAIDALAELTPPGTPVRIVP